MIYKFMCLLMTVCFHSGMTGNYSWDCGTPHEDIAAEGEYVRIHYDFLRDGGKIQYSHKVWCSIGHSHDKAQFLSQVSSPCGICGGQSDTRTHFFSSISVLPCHCHSIHIFILHTHLYIINLYNLLNRECHLMRRFTEGLRHWKDGNFGGDYFFKSTVESGKNKTFTYCVKICWCNLLPF